MLNNAQVIMRDGGYILMELFVIDAAGLYVSIGFGVFNVDNQLVGQYETEAAGVEGLRTLASSRKSPRP